MSARYLRFALALSLAAPALAAQQATPPTPPAPAGHDHQAKPALDADLGELFKGITLTDAQMRQANEIKTKHHAAMDEIRKNPGRRDSLAVRAELQQHMDAEHADFTALLTADQRKTFGTNMRAHHAPSAAKPAMDHGAHDMGKAPTKVPEPRRP